jgi:hypothetical protein
MDGLEGFRLGKLRDKQAFQQQAHLQTAGRPSYGWGDSRLPPRYSRIAREVKIARALRKGERAGNWLSYRDRPNSHTKVI